MIKLRSLISTYKFKDIAENKLNAIQIYAVKHLCEC